MFQTMLLLLLVHSSAKKKKTVSGVLQTWYFPYSAFWSTANGRPSRPGYAAASNVCF